MIEDWIFEDNALPFFEVMATIIGYEFDEDDWVALQHGFLESDTDTMPEKWYDYAFGDTKFWIGRDPGSSVMRLKIEASKNFVNSLQTVINIMNNYNVTK
jgi:hypothetical protein